MRNVPESALELRDDPTKLLAGARTTSIVIKGSGRQFTVPVFMTARANRGRNTARPAFCLDIEMENVGMTARPHIILTAARNVGGDHLHRTRRNTHQRM